MTSQRSFIRKIVYFSLIGVLLFPLYLLGLPSTPKSEGGKLAQIRRENNLSQANLGEIDPTSTTMKLTTLGLHGVAANLLWSKALDAKEREDWTTFSAALEQIMNLQPHFQKVWGFQAHNVSFNISYEFDDYRDRYHYILKGIKLLERGTRYNQKSHRIIRELAHFIGFKIGQSDEGAYYRPMFRDDDEFHETDRMAGTMHAGRSPAIRDNFLVSKWWSQRAEWLLDKGIASYMRVTPVVVHSESPHAQIKYARAIQEEGEFGDLALEAWNTASDDWQAFGRYPMPHDERGFSVKLGDYETQLARLAELEAEFDAFIDAHPGLRDRLTEEKRQSLSEEERAALDLPAEERDESQARTARKANRGLVLTPHELIAGLPEDQQVAGLQLADRLVSQRSRVDSYLKDRGIVNFDYWQIRCEVEKQPETIAARREIYLGNRAFADSDLLGALEHYEEGLQRWKEITEREPKMLDNETMIAELMQIIAKYHEILSQNGRELPDPFVLQNVLDRYKEKVGKGEMSADVSLFGS